MRRGSGKNTSFLSIFILNNMIILPRQTRDKHSKTQNRTRHFPCRMVDKATVAKLDGVPQSTADVLVRAIEMPVDWSQWPTAKPGGRSHALVWATGVSPSSGDTDSGSAGGVLISSGLNLLGEQFPCFHQVNLVCPPAAVERPESAWLLFKMVEAASNTPPSPKAQVNPTTWNLC
jgi:hypothetical protein